MASFVFLYCTFYGTFSHLIVNLTTSYLILDLIGAVHEIGSAQTTASAGKLNISFTVKDLALVFPNHFIENCYLFEFLSK
jgi:hypothetical protein